MRVDIKFKPFRLVITPECEADTFFIQEVMLLRQPDTDYVPLILDKNGSLVAFAPKIKEVIVLI
jgi:hypothetical protein